jgi:NitT/TauT family transport system ATP-binding protein
MTGGRVSGQAKIAPAGTALDTEGSPPALEACDVSFRHDPAGPLVLDGINMRVEAGEIVTLIGPSGCGKTSLLNLFAGITRPSGGSVGCFESRVKSINRRVTYMTQRDTLLPWRSALDNAALPLEIKGVNRRDRHQRARDVLRQMGVGDAAYRRRPHQLSGGMRSRVSIARALLSDADIILMDEPFAAIDALRRVNLQRLLLSAWERSHLTLVYVTHDLEEAITLGHRVVVMSSSPGRIHLERTITEPHPRDVVRFRDTNDAKQLYAELWNALERML